MSFIKTKSDENIAIANQLISMTTPYYATSVHCSYYSCVQLMIHILIEDFGKTESEIDNEPRAANMAFHNWIIDVFFREITIRRNPREAYQFKQKIGELKRARVNADYRNIAIIEQTSRIALQKAHQTINYLNTNFTI
jgi:hypothetical protein